MIYYLLVLVLWGRNDPAITTPTIEFIDRLACEEAGESWKAATGRDHKAQYYCVRYTGRGE